MSAVRKQLYYLWKKLEERRNRKQLKNYFKNDYKRFDAYKNKKPAHQMKREMKALQRYWGCYPYQYYRHDMYRNNCTLSLEEMKKYVPHFFVMSLFFQHSYKEYGIVCKDKLLTYALLKAYNVPQPKLLFCFDHNTFFDGENNPITASEVDAIIHASEAKILFAKPRFGASGKGISIFNKQNSMFLDEQHTPFDHTFFETASSKKAHGRDTSGFYVVQEGLLQHEELSRIYPKAVNTYRIITECIIGEARVLYSVLRMGSGGRQIDNSSAGGIFVRVDLETGALYESAQAFDQSTCTAHPDTKFVFKGVTLQTCAEVKSFTLAVARKFREIRYIGWDIAVTPEGPSVIEFNNKPDIDGIQDSYGGIRDDLNINPKDWWYQSNYTLKNL